MFCRKYAAVREQVRPGRDHRRPRESDPAGRPVPGFEAHVQGEVVPDLPSRQEPLGPHQMHEAGTDECEADEPNDRGRTTGRETEECGESVLVG
jgi:hypothetical protein